MEARIIRAVALTVAVLAMGASYRTQNFIITAPTDEFARQVGQEAERFRKELAILWLDHELPNWAEPCPIFLQVGANLGAGGATSFVFDRGEVFGWHMTIQGSPERILDSVLPHEVNHTIFASHFRRPLPRWADEGACTTVEHESERRKQQQLLVQFLQTKRGIAFSDMYVMRDYPQDVLPLYSQGYSLCRFLIQQGGRQKFISYIGEGMRSEQWAAVTKRFYGIENLAQLQTSWVDWVRQGSPLLETPAPATPADHTLLVSDDGAGRRRPAPNLIYRAQSEDPPVAPASYNSQPSAVSPLAPSGAEDNSVRLASGSEGWRTSPTATESAVYPADASERDHRAEPTPARMSAPSSTRQVLLEWSRDSTERVSHDLAPPGPANAPSPPTRFPPQAPIMDASNRGNTRLR